MQIFKIVGFFKNLALPKKKINKLTFYINIYILTLNNIH